jgi:hypothetical protein
MKNNPDKENKTPLFIEAASWLVFLFLTIIITYAAFFTVVGIIKS